MKRYLYVSQCLPKPFDIDDLDIMRESLRHNAQHGITGFLHRSASHYFQCIEGSDDAIDDLVVKIKADQRHSNFVTRLDYGIQAAAFAGWSMGYSRAPKDVQNQTITHRSSPEAILKFLLHEAEHQLEMLSKK